MASPAGPNLTPEHYQHILEILSANPRAENRAIRQEIAAYLEARKFWTEDARKRNIGAPS
jgi:hypothetical protein